MRIEEDLEKKERETKGLQSQKLHFDGKNVGKMEMLVVLLKNNNEDIRLDVLDLNDGKAVTAYGALLECLRSMIAGQI